MQGYHPNDRLPDTSRVANSYRTVCLRSSGLQVRRELAGGKEELGSRHCVHRHPNVPDLLVHDKVRVLELQTKRETGQLRVCHGAGLHSYREDTSRTLQHFLVES